MAKTTTSTRVKNKYNEKTYTRYTYRVRKDSPLYERIEQHKEHGGSVNGLITGALLHLFNIPKETQNPQQ